MGVSTAIELVYACRMELGLTEAIDTLVVAPHADAVIEVAQQYSTLPAKLALALAELDRRREFDYEGYASMTAWCRDKLGWTNQAANRLLKTGRRLLDLPVTRDAWAARDLTDGQVEIIVACVTDRRAGLWAEHEAEVVPLLGPVGCDPDQPGHAGLGGQGRRHPRRARPARRAAGRGDAGEDPRRPRLPQGHLRRRGHRDHRHRAAPGGLR